MIIVQINGHNTHSKHTYGVLTAEQRAAAAAHARTPTHSTAQHYAQHAPCVAYMAYMPLDAVFGTMSLIVLICYA